ncbi:hypothetical protein Zm00014a_000096, partial [Zea mays]
GLYNLNRL